MFFKKAAKLLSAALVCIASFGFTSILAQVKAPCYVVKDTWPIKTCKFETDPQICTRGFGAWQSEEVCCEPGVAFPEGCGKKLDECWVVESYQLKTCIRDDRKCLQGYGVWGSKAACCAPNAAFPTGCAASVPTSATACWVVDTYFPARLCRQSNTLCTSESGVQSWPNKDACCKPGNAFGEGCSASAPTAPCWMVDSYWPARKCRQETDIAACNRGWGVYRTKDICCAPGTSFPEGCTPDNTTVTAPAAGSSLPAANAAIAATAATIVPAATLPLPSNNKPAGANVPTTAAAAAKPASAASGVEKEMPAVKSASGP